MGLRAAKLYRNPPCGSLHGAHGRDRVPGALSGQCCCVRWHLLKALASPQFTFLRTQVFMDKWNKCCDTIKAGEVQKPHAGE